MKASSRLTHLQLALATGRYWNPRLITTFPARLLHVLDALFPALTAFGTSTAARLLPAPASPDKNDLHTGWESAPPLAPSALTKLADRAITPNNWRAEATAK